MRRSLRNLARLAAIGWTLARHDALFPLAELPPARPALWLARRLIRPRRAVAALRPGQRLAAAFEALGPGAIKLGQAMSVRADLFGEALSDDLAGLRDRLPPFDTAEAEATIAAELGAPVADLFEAFEREPVAAASIAQVHRARTTDGVEVAVKVLRPDIERRFARDVDLLLWLAEIVERTRPELRRLRPIDSVLEFRRTVELEMDLRFEAAAAEELAERFADEPGFRVPRVDWPRTAARVLTTEWIEGTPIGDRDALIAAGHDPETIVAEMAKMFFLQVFRDGFFHADLHPGNLFVDETGALVAVDFGIMGRLDRDTRRYLAEMLLGFLTGDYRLVAEVHRRAGYLPPDQSVEAFAQAARSIAEPILGLPLAKISLARLLAQLFAVTERFDMQTQPQLLLLQKTMLVAEGVGRSLYPDVNMWELARPMIVEWMRDALGPEARIAEAVTEAARGLERLPALAAKAETVLDALEKRGYGAAAPPPDRRPAGGTPRWAYVGAGAIAVALIWAVLG